MRALNIAMGALLLFLLSVAISVFWLLPLKVKLRLKRNGLRGPPPLFPLGNLLEISKRLKETSASSLNSVTHDIHSIVFPYFALWRKTYGKVFIYWLGTEPFLYVADPEFLKQVTSGCLGNKWGKPNVFKRDRKPMFGNGLLMVEGEGWSHHRNVIAPAFSMTNLNAMINMMMETTSKMLQQWDHSISMGKNEIDIERDITINAAKIIANVTFGISNEEGRNVFQKLQALQAILFKSNPLIGVPFCKFLNPKRTKEAKKLGGEIDHLLLKIIESRTREEDDANVNTHNDLLGLLLASNQESAKVERKLTSRELVDECKTFFFGGHETTSLALTWSLFLLAQYPQWQKALREEIMEVSKGEPLDSTMLPKLTKMEWIFNEVIRLYSPAPNSQRQAREDITVGNIHIPKGTNMWVDVVGMHHDRSLWGDDVNEFRPERFEGNLHGGCKHRMGFLPFGFGGRICIGRNLTITEYKIVLSHILCKFSMAVSPAYTHSPRIMLSLRPSHGVQLILGRIEESN
ncbi:uncharacterized protein A4U43_C01F8540 [Asparagus officinalis]|uniref:Cytochrome P450 n=1 Tax=Asparagus officinalis TaxID=4686 RepID=A0A5P1FSG6_ASPOF|nr:cytokinin hydroxylase [Asparagus officinalis]ONK79651.1 uncharacterized protein A4U43_C01F8540 [Asparagus officinalis]